MFNRALIVKAIYATTRETTSTFSASLLITQANHAWGTIFAPCRPAL